MIKGYKIRIYPDKNQQKKIMEHIGACRFIWNYMLDLQEERHVNNEKHLSAFDMNRLLTPLKKEEQYTWLKSVSNKSLQSTCVDLNNAYVAFFEKRNRVPKYKSRKRSKLSYPVRADVFRFDGSFAVIEKLGKVKYKSDYIFPDGRGHKFLNVRISYENDKYMLSFSLECESQAVKLNDIRIGIDLGVKSLAVCSYGDCKIVYQNINKSRKIRYIKKRIKYLQRVVSRKYDASRKRNNGRCIKTNNIKKVEKKLHRLYRRLSNIRTNYTHQITHQIVSLLPATIVVEDLSVSSMMKNKSVCEYVWEQRFYEFIRQIEYKCAWNGIEFIKANRFYPSSKTCSKCGNIKNDLVLSDRVYVCRKCGLVIDRDYNAAINLSRYTCQ